MSADQDARSNTDERAERMRQVNDEQQRSSQKSDDRAQKTKNDNPEKPVAKWPFVSAALVVAVFVGVVLWIIFCPAG
jgi:F0F1-type ATP synthase assembly protein I